MYHDDGNVFWIEGRSEILHRGNLPLSIWNSMPVEFKIHIIDSAQHMIVETPRKCNCAYCGEVIWPFEKRGPIININTHVECSFRMVGGSVGHQQGICDCHGFEDKSEEGMSKREAARRALAYYQNTKK